MLRPSINSAAPSPHLDKAVPEQFGDWRTLPNPLIQADLSTDGATSTDQPYDEIVSRTYVNSSGDVVMMALAYGKNQRQEIKIHRPELCYPAQGFKVVALKPAVFEGIHSALSGSDVVGKAHGGARQRPRRSCELLDSHWRHLQRQPLAHSLADHAGRPAGAGD